MGFGETSVLWVSKPSLAGRHATNKIRRPATARQDFAPRQIREIMKKRSEVGCGPLFSVLRKSGRLFDLDRSSSILSKIVERGFERLSLEAILIDLQ